MTEQLLNGQCPMIQVLAKSGCEQEFYLVIEFIPGQPLSQELLSDCPRSRQQVIELLIEILEILDFVHRQGVIHRDIKPDNLMRQQTDRALVLIDFGSVKKLCEITQPDSHGAANEIQPVLPHSILRETTPSSIQPTLLPVDRQLQNSMVQIAPVPLNVSVKTKCCTSFPLWLMGVGGAMLIVDTEIAMGITLESIE